ncbi:MAG TPA: energy transducer TonB [Pyrinomonadaceae bacterium]|nr:energy transducer TonB [Pyrinomonadaceae bacterium]
MSKKSISLTASAFALCFSLQASAQQRSNGAANGFQPANASATTSASQPSNSAQPASAASSNSDRAQDGLIGPVRRVRTETVKLTNKNGQMIESQRVLIESSAYDINGHKTENQYFPVTGASLTGHEAYSYDAHGNISEMTLHDASGALITKEVYTYEYDFVGNWTKMMTSVAVFENGHISFEPTEVTYRTFSYYIDENLTRMMQAAQGGQQSAASPGTSGQASANAQHAPSSQATSQPAQSARALPQASSGGVSMMAVSGNAQPAVNSSSAVVNRVDDAPPAPVARILKPVSGGVLNGVARSLPSPVYPETAKRSHTTGIVTVEVVVDETGHVISARATSGPMILQQSATQAARQAQFSPTKLSGLPVKVTGTINYNFQLSQ